MYECTSSTVLLATVLRWMLRWTFLPQPHPLALWLERIMPVLLPAPRTECQMKPVLRSFWLFSFFFHSRCQCPFSGIIQSPGPLSDLTKYNITLSSSSPWLLHPTNPSLPLSQTNLVSLPRSAFPSHVLLFPPTLCLSLPLLPIFLCASPLPKHLMQSARWEGPDDFFEHYESPKHWQAPPRRSASGANCSMYCLAGKGGGGGLMPAQPSLGRCSGLFRDLVSALHPFTGQSSALPGTSSRCTPAPAASLRPISQGPVGVAGRARYVLHQPPSLLHIVKSARNPAAPFVHAWSLVREK